MVGSPARGAVVGITELSPPPSTPPPGTPAVSPCQGDSYWLTAADGGVFSYGCALYFGSMGGQHLAAPVVGMASDGVGYRLVGGDGGVFNFEAVDPSVGAPQSYSCSSAPSGYWVATTTGGVYSFGNAEFEGSAGDTHLAARVVAMAAPPGSVPACPASG